MPASSATTRTRTPETTPMPQIVPPPGTERSTSSTSWRQPASVDSSRKGTPGSSRRATRSRGSSWPRFSNSGAAFALAARVRASIARHCSIRSSVWRRLAANASPARVERERQGGHRRLASGVAQHARRGGEMEAVEGRCRSAGADLGPDPLGVRRRAVDAQAGAGDEGGRRREQEDDRRRRPRSRCRAGAAAPGLSCRAAAAPSRAGSGPCRSTRSSPARRR